MCTEKLGDGSDVLMGFITIAKANGLQNCRAHRREKLLMGKAVVLLGNLETGRREVMQDDYYWLEVTSWFFSPP